MNHKILFLLLAGWMILSLTSCNKEAEEDRILAYATITDATNKILVTDVEGERLYVEQNATGITTWTNGARLVVDYTRIRVHENASMLKSYYVRINGVYPILTKSTIRKSFLNTTAREDSIGHDPINLRDVWFANDYINVNFGIYRNNPGIIHLINLVIDDSKSTSDMVYAELRHNAYFDLQSVGTFGNVSFKISDYVVPPKTSVKIVLSRLTYSGALKSDTLTYNSGSAALAPVVHFTRSLIQ